ncbi:MAG: serine hydroxymethyltransferase, partial [Chloroflexota bacterium]
MSDHDFLVRGALEEIDADVAELIRHETARQARRLIMIPSESTIPQAVREAVGSAFHNIYAEGYPTEAMRWMSEDEILDYDARMADYRRNSDARYYKGTEYANIVESLARRRVAEAFANEHAGADDLYVNVQPLSGAPANSAAFTALLEVGDTVMGLDLLDGGHLTHGSPVNRSGIQYNFVSYGVDPATERIDYDDIRRIALECQPKMIICGFTSYPIAPDFAKFREIADEVGAYLLADIAHTAGMAVAGAYPNPVGIADVVNFTTHKTLNGPRGAVSITHKRAIARKIDRGVFPGEQGGPHVNSIAGLAVAMKIAKTEKFHTLQHQTAKNAVAMAEAIQERGVRIAYGGTNTHMMLVDCKAVVGADGATLSGDLAARILDLAGIVANRNTIPGDKSPFRASGVRLGTAWITQRGFDEEKSRELGNIIADLLFACTPYYQDSKKGRQVLRTKVDFDALQQATLRVRDLVNNIGIDTDETADGYPHFYYMEAEDENLGWQTLTISGKNADEFMDKALTGIVAGLGEDEIAPTWLLEPDGSPMTRGYVERTPDGYALHIESQVKRVTAWLRALSDGFVLFDPTDLAAKLSGPVMVHHTGDAPESLDTSEWMVDTGYTNKPYFIGINGENLTLPAFENLPVFEWVEPQRDDLLTTPLHSTHVEMGAKMVPFAGYDMPVYYSSVSNEHNAVRDGAGVFDVTHMGVFEAHGAGAAHFVNTVFTNDVTKIAVGNSQYGFLLDVYSNPLDDLLVYRLAEDHFLLVVNASNNDKNWAWLNGLKNGELAIEADRPYLTYNAGESFELRDLRDESAGEDRRVDIALQGPKSMDVMRELGDTTDIKALKWAGITRATLCGFDIIVSRTGYTGERMGFELFVHPDNAPHLFRELVNHGAEPCGLAARDSLRTEAGLPLYDHELGGDMALKPGDAGMGSFVRPWKPFFVGKRPYMAYEQQRDAEVVRFRLERKGARPPKQGDPVIDYRGRVVGMVTSCTPDSEGFQLGLAYLKQAAGGEGTPIGIYAGGLNGKSSNGVEIGSKLPVPQTATIVS